MPRDLDVPYKTRLVVRRPADARRFRGTVVVEWFNSTASFDSAPVWDASAEFFAREGWIYVGVTNSNTPIAFLKGGCRLGGVLLVANCRQRYASLALPENGQAYELMSQLAHAVKQGGAASPLPADYRVRARLPRRAVAAGRLRHHLRHGLPLPGERRLLRTDLQHRRARSISAPSAARRTPPRTRAARPRSKAASGSCAPTCRCRSTRR